MVDDVMRNPQLYSHFHIHTSILLMHWENTRRLTMNDSNRAINQKQMQNEQNWWTYRGGIQKLHLFLVILHPMYGWSSQIIKLNQSIVMNDKKMRWLFNWIFLSFFSKINLWKLPKPQSTCTQLFIFLFC